MSIQFWTNNPTILFNKEYIFELWPTTNMCYEQKLNAITRLVILITILVFSLFCFLLCVCICFFFVTAHYESSQGIRQTHVFFRFFFLL